MKRKVFCMLGVLGVLLVSGVSCKSQGSDYESEFNSLKITNSTGSTITFVFVSPGDSEFWGADILGAEDTFSDGESLDFVIHYPDDCNNFDIMAITEDNKSYVITDFEICDGTAAAVSIDESSYAEDDFGFESMVTVSLQNTLKSEIKYLFISPSDSKMFGIGMLGKGAVVAPDGVVSYLIPARDDVVEYDIIGIVESGDTYSFKIDVSAENLEAGYEIEESDLDEE